MIGVIQAQLKSVTQEQLWRSLTCLAFSGAMILVYVWRIYDTWHRARYELVNSVAQADGILAQETYVFCSVQLALGARCASADPDRIRIVKGHVFYTTANGHTKNVGFSLTVQKRRISKNRYSCQSDAAVLIPASTS